MQTTSNSEQHTASEREVTTDCTATASLHDVLHSQTDTSTITERESGEEVITTKREYDTDKPVDPATGTPPLKRETTQTRRKADTGRQEQTTLQSTDRQINVAGQVAGRQTDDTNIHENSWRQGNAATRVETTERRGLSTLQKTLCIIGALAVLAGLAWFVLKRKRIL